MGTRTTQSSYAIKNFDTKIKSNGQNLGNFYRKLESSFVIEVESL